MKKLLEFLFPFFSNRESKCSHVCFHEWEIEYKRDIYPFNPFEDLGEGMLRLLNQNSPDVMRPYNIKIGTKYILRCKKCGDMKTFYDELRPSK